MRIIHYIDPSGSREGIYLTEDNNLDAREVLPPNCEVINDFDPYDGWPVRCHWTPI